MAPDVVCRHRSGALRFVAVLLGLLALSWGVQQVRSGAALQEARRLYMEEPQALVLRDEPPQRARLAMRIADWLSLETFPPDHDLALAMVQHGLQLDPLSSEAWLRVARIRVLQGRDDEARAALAFSDARDPHFPRQRLESVRLWRLLGNGERALATAEQIASLGPGFAREVAEELVLSGVSAAEAFERVGGREAEPDEVADLLLRLHGVSPSESSGIWNGLPPELASHPSVRAAAVEIFRAPLDPERLLEVWREAADVPHEGAVFLDNPALTVSPWANTLALGWQPFDGGSGTTAAYVAPIGGVTGNRGSVRIEAGRFSRDVIRWSAYRFVHHSGEELRVRVPVRHQPTGDGRARVIARAQGRSQHSEFSNALREGWQELVVAVPPGDGPMLVEVQLEWILPERALRRGPVSLYVQGLEVQAKERSE